MIDSRHGDVVSGIKGITGRGVEYVVETTGNWKMCQLATIVLNPNGTVAFLTGAGASGSLTEGRKTLGIIQGDAVPQRFIPKLIELFQKGLFPFDRLVAFYNFDRINMAIAEAMLGDTIKPVLLIGEV